MALALDTPASEDLAAGSAVITHIDALPARLPRFYQPELDLLRLLAFFMVWLSHALLSFTAVLPARWLAVAAGAGSCGVPIFFFLSAYLITELLRRERLVAGRIHLRFFYLRRILRIWPLYFAVLGAYALLGLRFHGFRIEPGRLLASCLLAGNWYIAMHPAITTPLRALWSISVEEQWYLLWPLLQRKLSSGCLLAVCCATFAAAQGSLTLLAHRPAAPMLHVTAWVNSLVQFQYFALGAAAALLLKGRIPRLHASIRLLLAVGGFAALLLAAGACHIRQAGITHTAAALCRGYGLAGVGAGCLFFALLGIPAGRCPGVMFRLVRLGQLSFGLYVFHETGFFLADAALRHLHAPSTTSVLAAAKLAALACTVAMAFASYYAWELPFLRLKQRWTVVRTREAQ